MLNNLRENRAISFQTVWGAGGDLASASNAGVIVNNKTAFEIVAFTSAVSLIADTVSTLPVDCFIRNNGDRKPFRPKPTWVDQPDVDQTKSGHYNAVLVSLMIDGNAFVRIYRDRAGEIVNLVCLDPSTVSVKRNGLGRKIFEVVGEEKALGPDEMMHITDLLEPGALRGMSRVNRLSDALGVATALQQYAARFFGQGASMSGVIEYPGALTAQQAKDLSDAFDSRHRGLSRAHRTGVISGGAKFSSTQVTNDAAQFLESRRFAVEEIARLYNIPLSMMGVPGTQSYASVEQNAIQFVTHTLRPYIEKLEWSYSRLLPDTAFLKFNVDGLLRGDFNSRISAYSVALQGGWESINDIRRLEDQSPIEGGDVYRVPLANVNLSAADIPEMEGKVNMAQQLIGIGFDPAAVLVALGLPTIAHTGLPSTKLQQVQNIDPNNPGSVY